MKTFKVSSLTLLLLLGSAAGLSMIRFADYQADYKPDASWMRASIMESDDLLASGSGRFAAATTLRLRAPASALASVLIPLTKFLRRSAGSANIARSFSASCRAA